MADLVQWDYEGKSVGLTPMNLSKTTIARFFRVPEEGFHLKIVKNREVRKCITGTMWLPFLLKIKTYKRMMMMIFREHLVLGTYAPSFEFAIYFFFNVLFRYFIKNEKFKSAI